MNRPPYDAMTTYGPQDRELLQRARNLPQAPGQDLLRDALSKHDAQIIIINALMHAEEFRGRQRQLETANAERAQAFRDIVRGVQ